MDNLSVDRVCCVVPHSMLYPRTTEKAILVNDNDASIDKAVSVILDSLRPTLTTALRMAFEHGQRFSDARYSDKIAQAYRLLSELNPIIPTTEAADETDTPAETHSSRAALGT